jgi:hypothetical protein
MRRNGHKELMSEAGLLKLVKQGAADAGAPAAGRRSNGSDWIVKRANANDKRPVWILVWGSPTDVAQAMHDDPGIASKIRLLTIGANNTRRDPAARQYIVDGLASKCPPISET